MSGRNRIPVNAPVQLIAVAAAISLLFLLSMASLSEVSASPPLHPVPAPASVEPGPCYATPNGGVSVYNSADSSAVQMAVDALEPLSDTVTVWGTCTGVQERAGIDQSLYISRSVRILGDAGLGAVIDADDAGRVVVVDGDVDVVLEHLDMRSGNAAGQDGPTPDGDNNGGALLVHSAAVTLTHVDASDNAATLGAGVYNDGGRLTIHSSGVYSNQAQNGGGVFNTATGTLAVVNSTFSQNSATQRGGHVRNDGIMTVTNSTLAHGSAGTDGGGIRSSGDELWLANSVLADNDGGDCISVSGVVSAAATLFSNSGASACGQVDGVDGNRTGADPALDPLADKGGSTLTYAFAYTSPLRNTGIVSLAVDSDGQPLLFDQRGVGYPRVVGGSVDMGAYEASFTQTITVVKALSPTDDSGLFVMAVNGISGTAAGDGAYVTTTLQVSDMAHFSETAGADTDLIDYVTEWRCDDPAVTSGVGVTGSLTIPAADVVCVITNTRIPPTTGSITGTVVATDSMPIFGVKVTVDNATAAVDVGEILSTTTDADGEYLLEDVAPGATQLIFEKLGFMPNAADVTVTVGVITHAPIVTMTKHQELSPSAIFVPEVRTSATR